MSDTTLEDLIAGVTEAVGNAGFNVSLEGLVGALAEGVLNGTVVDTESSGFEFTDDMDYMSSIAGSGLSLLLNVFACLASAWIYSVPSARHHLDRVSFRLFLWSMAVEVIYNIAYISLFVDPKYRLSDHTSCGAGFYFLISTMGTANWLCTFIGVNLMLAICFGVNPVRARLERWYILVSFFMGFGISIIFAALGHFGVDTVYEECWFTNTDQDGRIRDFIVDLYLWQILSAVIAAVSVLAVLITLFRQSRATGQALFSANKLNTISADLPGMASEQSSPAQTSFFRRDSKAFKMHRLQDKFITIALKISLYPVALIIVNSIITAGDLEYTVRGGLHSQQQYVVYCLYYFLYGGRGIFFALIGIFVDPCLRRGLPAAYKATFHRPSHILPISAEIDEHSPAQSLSDFLSSTGPEEVSKADFREGLTREGGRRHGRWAGWWGRRRAENARPVEVLEEEPERGDCGDEKQPASDESGDTIFWKGGIDSISFTPATPPISYNIPSASTYFPLSPHNPLEQPTLSQHTLPSPPRSAIEPMPVRGRSLSFSAQLLPNYPNPAVLSPRPDPRLDLRRSSHPALMVSAPPTGESEQRRRRREIRMAADKAFAEIQAQL